MPQGCFIAPQLWRFESRQSDVKLDTGGQRATKTVASDAVGIDERCSRGVSSTVAVPPAVAASSIRGCPCAYRFSLREILFEMATALARREHIIRLNPRPNIGSRKTKDA